MRKAPNPAGCRGGKPSTEAALKDLCLTRITYDEWRLVISSEIALAVVVAKAIRS